MKTEINFFQNLLNLNNPFQNKLPWKKIESNTQGIYTQYTGIK